ncbi:PREDICTED: putative uncharacterized protein C10orf99 homolog [Galeopterus variegatus]|uniref:Uncharacterized protein n=1 Tax=Galeopterus variegatus TaxID=482537 RepID=A0ABM0RUM0_GALVR|nr:PREDICTED: putative uncharacterized protein C10orf99 homolog [Galeopterus variegatus]
MRLCGLLCILLLCCSIFSAEGRRHPAKLWRAKPCCRQVPRYNQMTPKRYCTRLCRLRKPKPGSSSWVVPGALPQV